MFPYSSKLENILLQESIGLVGKKRFSSLTRLKSLSVAIVVESHCVIMIESSRHKNVDGDNI